MLGLNFINAQSSGNTGLNIVFEESSFKFTEPEKDLITKTIVLSEKEIRTLLPKLPKNIKIFLEIMDRDLFGVGGTTGRAQKHEPDGEVYVYISNLYYLRYYDAIIGKSSTGRTSLAGGPHAARRLRITGLEFPFVFKLSNCCFL